MSLLNKLKPALTAHSRAEEIAVYEPLLALKRTDDESSEIANEGFVEHSLIDELLMQLKSSDAGTDVWKAKAKVLKELLEHHIDEEQSETFAKLGSHFSSDELAAMGVRFLREKAKRLRTPPRKSKRAPTRARQAPRRKTPRRAARA